MCTEDDIHGLVATSRCCTTGRTTRFISRCSKPQQQLTSGPAAQKDNDAGTAVVNASNPAFVTLATTTLQPLPVGTRLETLVTCPFTAVAAVTVYGNPGCSDSVRQRITAAAPLIGVLLPAIVTLMTALQRHWLPAAVRVSRVMLTAMRCCAGSLAGQLPHDACMA